MVCTAERQGEPGTEPAGGQDADGEPDEDPMARARRRLELVGRGQDARLAAWGHEGALVHWSPCPIVSIRPCLGTGGGRPRWPRPGQDRMASVRRRAACPAVAPRAATIAVVAWEELRAALRELSGQRPCPLRSWPDPDAGDPPLPAPVRLAAWAVDAAEALHARFGDDLVITVGFLRYPSARLVEGRGTEQTPPEPSRELLLEPGDVEVVAPSPLAVRAGEDVRAELQVTNHRPVPVTIATNGAVLGRVLDRTTGEVVGGFNGAVTVPLVVFTVEPGATISVPLVTGTASYRGVLGYAVPPGAWSIELVLRLGEGVRRAPPLPLRVLERSPGG